MATIIPNTTSGISTQSMSNLNAGLNADGTSKTTTPVANTNTVSNPTLQPGQVSTGAIGQTQKLYTSTAPTTTSTNPTTQITNNTTSQSTNPSTTQINTTSPVTNPTNATNNSTTNTSNTSQTAQPYDLQTGEGLNTQPVDQTKINTTLQPQAGYMIKYDSNDNAVIAPMTAQDQQDALQATQNKETTDFSTAVTNIENGTTPLNAGEQAQVDQLKQQYADLIQKQGLANSSATGAASTSAARMGSEEYSSSSTGNIASVVSAGVQKIQSLQTEEAAAVSKLTEALQNNDISEIKTAYDALNANQASQSKTLQDTIDTANAAITAQNAELQKQQDAFTATQSDLLKEAQNNGAKPDVLKAIGASTDVASALTAGGNYLQSSTDAQMNNYLQYKRDATVNNQSVQDYTTWKAADDANTEKEKEAEAYGTAFATQSGKNAATPSSSSSDTSPITSPSGLVYNAPADVAPYVSFSGNGVKYVDLSNFSGTPTEKNQAVQDAQSAGYKVITNKNTAADVQNITNALSNLTDIKSAFDANNAGSAAQRDTYKVALDAAAKFLQTNPDSAALDSWNSSAGVIVKAISGIQGGAKGGAALTTLLDSFPKLSDTQAVADQKIANIEKQINNRQTTLVGSPSASDQAMIDGKNHQDSITQYATKNPADASKIADMITAANGDTEAVYANLKARGILQ